MVQSLTSPRNAQALRQEIGCLLEKGAVERVPPHELESGFYSRYFRGTQEGWGASPNFGSQAQSQSALRTSVQDGTLKQILAQIRPGDWFASVDLKDALLSHSDSAASQTVSEVCFREQSVPILCSPVRAGFGPAHIFKVCGCSTFPPQSGRDAHPELSGRWLILAQSRDTLLSHIDSLLIHLESLGLCVNRRKSILAPSQSILYLGVCIDSLEMRARLSRERVAAILSYLRHFREGSSVHLKEFQRLRDSWRQRRQCVIWAYYTCDHCSCGLKTRVPWTAWTSGRLSIAVTRGCIEALAPWRNPNFFSRGVPPGVGNLTRGGHNGRIDARLGSGVRGDASFGAVVRATDPMAHKPIGIGKQSF